MNDWEKLEKDFRDIPNPFLDMRADWSDQESIPNRWEIKGGIDRYARDRFKAYAKQAGRLLLKSKTESISKCSTDLQTIEDDMSRWLTAVKEITDKCRYDFLGISSDDTTFILGKIDRIIEVSATLCSQLSTEETTTSSTQVESEVILCLQTLPQNRKFKNYYTEIVIYPGKGENEKPCRLGKAMLRFFWLTLNAKIQGLEWINFETLKTELNYDNSDDQYWFIKRINYIKKWINVHELSKHFEFSDKRVRSLLSKEQISFNIPDYKKAKSETKT
ncbi:hypothetical protein ACFL1R_11545 [Candidatus Latescibacterota bacterium]